MRCTRLWTLLLAAVLALQLAGCGGGAKTPASGAPATPALIKTGVKHYERSDLPAVDEDLFVIVDGGRIEIAPPEQWTVAPRQKNYLVLFVPGKLNDLPRISVTVVDSPFGNEDTSEENAAALAKAVQTALENDKAKRVRELPKAIVLGGRAWVRHVRQATMSKELCAVQSLQIVRGGRLYTIELISQAKSDAQADIAAAVTRHRDRAYAVAANIRFTQEAGFGAPPLSNEKPAEERPAAKPAEKPAEEKAVTKPEEKKTE